jgi:RimJ/RimL family protein N-acetyltransferase
MHDNAARPRFQPLCDGTIELRALELEDVAAIATWHNDPSIRDQILSFRFPVSHVMETRFIERAINGDGITQCVAGIVDLADNAFCGLVYLRDIDWVSQHAAFGILVGRRDRQQRGIGRRALRLMLRHAFDVLNLERVYLYVVEYNLPARKLYETTGFVVEGRLRQHVALEAKRYDLLVMGILRNEFESERLRNG